MKAKNLEKIAKSLFKKSLNSDGFVDTKKVQVILNTIVSQKPPQLIKILKIYKKLIATALSREELVFETAQKLPNQKKLEQNLFAKTGATRINYKINPNIVLGARITHGDWVWDETLQAKLENLTKAN